MESRSHRWLLKRLRKAKRSGLGYPTVSVLRFADGESRDRSASGPAMSRAFLLVVAFLGMLAGLVRQLVGRSDEKRTREAPSALRPESTSAFAYLKSD